MMSKKINAAYKKSGQVYKKSGQKIESLFYHYPSAVFSIRKIALKTGLTKSTVQYRMKKLKDEGVISKDGSWIDNWKNRLKKSQFFVNKITESGLVEYLENELAATTLILFGSFAKGESVKESDVDIFVECAKNKEVNLSKYNKIIGHEIQLFKRHKITQLPKNLLNNVVNGIKLKGYFTIK